jgi:hypothetical protein
MQNSNAKHMTQRLVERCRRQSLPFNLLRNLLHHLLKKITKLRQTRLKVTGTSQGWGHSDLLATIITDEKTCRDSAHIKRRIKSARLRTDACNEKIDTTTKLNLSAAQLRALMKLNFPKDPRKFPIQSPTGVGKTYLATAAICVPKMEMKVPLLYPDTKVMPARVAAMASNPFFEYWLRETNLENHYKIGEIKSAPYFPLRQTLIECLIGNS